MRTIQHRYGAPTEDDSTYEIEEAMLGPGESKGTREGMGREEHKEADLQGRKEEVGSRKGRGSGQANY